ncbi:MAG TPA: maleylpyruvate isomerase family mycothiol-dependent enzyme [Acidimicrobiales bacterium]|jgi:uncharacterized protein (TIGR03083 family)|nr:maleylpyruvate isomerase family mycothiol-dependent enzyme [Acidimicrobiales bacterium]
MERVIGPLRASVARLHGLVGGFDDGQLEGPSYDSDWTVADVLSHLGSGAVLMERRLDDARSGVESTIDPQPVWDEWNAKTPRAKADDALTEDERLLRSIASLTESQWEELTFNFGPVTVGVEAAVALRLNEHAFHTWDIEVMSDKGATLPPDAVAVVVDNLGFIARFTAKPAGGEREVWVRTTDPERHFTVRLTDESAELLEGDAGASDDLVLPAEAFCRLVYGRLDPDHSPEVDENGEVLDLLRRVFPGP